MGRTQPPHRPEPETPHFARRAMDRQLIYRGSVKDLYREGDRLIFAYSDRYSIYDWGEMPDAIPHKGEALASLMVSFFEFLARRGIRSHYLGQIGRTEIAVRPTRVLRPTWRQGSYDYSAYAAHPTDALVPLEVIFRLALAQGNSLERRLRENPAYLGALGLAAVPDADTLFDPPLIEFSSKLESTDRYLTPAEIERLDILALVEIDALRRKTRELASHLKTLFDRLGVRLWDGKFEFAFSGGQHPQREFLLVDSIGPDELRLTYDALPLSKEFLRQIYTRTDAAWIAGLRRAKQMAKERKSLEWKRICLDELHLEPRHLTPSERDAASLLYQALANEVALAVGRVLPFDAAIRLPLWRDQARQLSASAG